MSSGADVLTNLFLAIAGVVVVLAYMLAYRKKKDD